MVASLSPSLLLLLLLPLYLPRSHRHARDLLCQGLIPHAHTHARTHARTHAHLDRLKRARKIGSSRSHDPAFFLFSPHSNSQFHSSGYSAGKEELLCSLLPTHEREDKGERERESETLARSPN